MAGTTEETTISREIKVSKGLSGRFPEIDLISKSVQCPICYDGFRDAVSTPCGHDFCSLCVRDYLQYKQQCPSCLKELHETRLWSNKALTSITALVLVLIQKLEESFRNEQIQAINAVFKPTPTKKSGLPSTPKRAEKVSAASSSAIATSSTPKRVDTVSAELPSATATSASETLPSEIVHCPVCQVGVPERNVNQHLDQCLQEQSGARVKPRTNTPKLKPMKKVVYHLLKDAQLKKLIKDEGLSAKGDRKTLEWRHKRFTVLWNAQCDSERPASRLEIRIELEKEEKQLNTEKSKPSSEKTLEYDRNTDPAVISSKQEQYVSKNKSSFENLIKQIRQRKAKENVPENAKPAENQVGSPASISSPKKIQGIVGTSQTPSTSKSPLENSDEQDFEVSTTKNTPAKSKASHAKSEDQYFEPAAKKSRLSPVPSASNLSPVISEGQHDITDFISDKVDEITDNLENKIKHDSEDLFEEDDFVTKTPVSKKTTKVTTPSSGKRKRLSSKARKSTCPVCNQLVSTHLINSHLDYCFEKQNKPSRAQNGEDFEVFSQPIEITPDIIEGQSSSQPVGGASPVKTRSKRKAAPKLNK